MKIYYTLSDVGQVKALLAGIDPPADQLITCALNLELIDLPGFSIDKEGNVTYIIDGNRRSTIGYQLYDEHVTLIDDPVPWYRGDNNGSICKMRRT